MSVSETDVTVSVSIRDKCRCRHVGMIRGRARSKYAVENRLSTFYHQFMVDLKFSSEEHSANIFVGQNYHLYSLYMLNYLCHEFVPMLNFGICNNAKIYYFNIDFILHCVKIMCLSYNQFEKNNMKTNNQV